VTTDTFTQQILLNSAAATRFAAFSALHPSSFIGYLVDQPISHFISGARSFSSATSTSAACIPIPYPKSSAQIHTSLLSVDPQPRKHSQLYRYFCVSICKTHPSPLPSILKKVPNYKGKGNELKVKEKGIEENSGMQKFEQKNMKTGADEKMIPT
jgi:hypothetical protein